MRRARRRSRRGGDSGGDSLELLLDTICNTFGGVLFIAILLAISVRPPSAAPSDPIDRPDPATVAELAAAGRIEGLRQDRDELKRLLGDLDGAARAAGLDEFRAEQADLAALQAEVAAAESRIAETEAEAAALSERADARTAAAEAMEQQAAADAVAIAGLEREIAELEQAAAEDSTRTVTLAMPKVEPADDRREFGLVVENDRVYQWHRMSGREFVGVNTDDMGPSVRMDHLPFGGPRPGGGILLTGPRAPALVQAMLRKYPPRQFTFVLIVRTDSHDTFGLVRDTIKSLGGRYRVLAGNDSITLGGGVGGGTQ